MNERLKVENLFKIFTDRPDQALSLLRAGRSKAEVLKTINQVVGLHDVSLTIPEGSMYMIMGMSGSGKSTLARCINRLNEPSAGKILLDGEDICTLNEKALREVRRTRISMVFQHFALLPNRSVIDNVEFGLKLRGMSAGKRRQRADEVLNTVGLSGWANRLPHELSGGMRQRVGLARALATDADILIMDEAFSALDPLIRSEMQDELLRLQKTLRKTILFITHDFQEALKLGTRIAIMADGCLVREGTPQSIVLEPGSDYVGAFTRDVDRGRLFDAGSIMTPLSPLIQCEQGTVMGNPTQEDGAGFLLNHERRVVGTLSASDIARMRQGETQIMASPAFTCIRTDTKLVDVAAYYEDDRAIAVTDASGHLLGSLQAGQILARIASNHPVASNHPTSISQHKGNHHV